MTTQAILQDDSDTARPDDGRAPMLKYVSSRAWGRKIVAVFLMLVIVSFLVSIADNPNFGWKVVGEYLFDPRILSGLWLTVWLTGVTMLIGVVLGTICAVMSMSTNGVIATVAKAYIWFFRGTPVLVQLIFWYNLGALFPALSVGIPFTSLWVSIPTNDAITPIMAAVLGLGPQERRGLPDGRHSIVSGVDRRDSQFRLDSGGR